MSSPTLHGSESLCKLLRYLADQAIKHPGVPLKEYQIATEVFGRTQDFDPHLDSLVRVQAGRLRSKLFEYYASEGSEDPLVVELPKGTYGLVFHPAVGSSKASLRAVRPVEPERRVDTVSKSSRLVLALFSLLTLSVAAIVFLLLTRSSRVPANPTEPTPVAFRVFWRSFIAGPEQPWVIFSNGAFVGRPETGLRYFDPRRDSRQAILDHYTGVGEVLAVDELDQLLTRLGRGIRVKRGSLFTLDDANNNNLIFVGSPAENLSLLDLPSTREFAFRRLTSGPRKGDLGVENVHPRTGEPKMFFASPSSTPLVEDYAIVGLERGLNPELSALFLAGTTTIGTQAAADYVCREESLEQLLLRLSVSATGAMKPFEALLRVKVARGVPVATELVLLREL